MSDFEHLRHKGPTPLERPRELVIACMPLRSNVNLSRILRAAGCCGVERVIACGNPKVDADIARDAASQIKLDVRRSLPPVIRQFAAEGFCIVGLEQTTNSISLPEYQFQRKSLLVIGNERIGLDEELLKLMHDTVEIPVFGMPHSFNVATATAIALYEYCCQFPAG